MKKDKNILIGIVIIIVIISAVMIYKKQKWFFKMNLNELATISIVGYLSYYLSSKKDYENQKNSKSENIIYNIRNIIETGKISSNINNKNKKNTQINIKLINNKLKILKAIFKNDEEKLNIINIIKTNFDKYNDIIVINSSESDKYFRGKRDYLESLIVNIEIQLDYLEISIYGIKL